MYVHDPDKPYQCEDCQQTFSFESELASHRMKHRTSPSFKCMFHNCGKEFRRMSELNSHVVVHSGRMYNCKKCNYSSNNPDIYVTTNVHIQMRRGTNASIVTNGLSTLLVEYGIMKRNINRY